MQLDSSVQFIKGVGERRAKAFAKLGIFTVGDLICHYPKTYIDYSKPFYVAAAPYDNACVIKATVFSIGALQRISGGRQMQKIIAGDETGTMQITFFNNPYIAKKLEIEKEYLFYGKCNGRMDMREMVSPVFISAGKKTPFIPVYPLTAGITSNYISTCVKNALDALPGILPDAMPVHIIQKYKLMSYNDAIRQIHFPSSAQAALAAKHRLTFEEIFIFQLGLFALKGQNHTNNALPMLKQNLDAFFAGLPFTPTNAQMRAVFEICADLKRNTPMNRLLQGDVGSGKTLVAAAAMLVAMQNGMQSVLMAPTEILAVQHANTLTAMLGSYGVNIALLTGSVKGKAKAATLAAIKSGEANIVIGTHAVLSNDVQFNLLGLVITDEQHRFGVRQRGLLSQKAARPPHVLVMSATPIPRTLGLLIFGDLDISILDEIPPGRTQVKTYLVGPDKRMRMFGFIEKHVAQGRQAFIVCPLIEESESDFIAVTTYFEQIAKPILTNCRIGLLHGKMKSAQKAQVMQDFKDHKLDVLCCTTVIEVGVDIPNANIMVIENAERYGLSALHQLRGRVGRGSAESFCILVSEAKGEDAKNRLHTMCHVTDGFVLAQKDMETRGPGDFFGNRQHGLPMLKLASLINDSQLLYIAQAEAQSLLKSDMQLLNYPLLQQQIEKLFNAQTAFN